MTNDDYYTDANTDAGPGPDPDTGNDAEIRKAERNGALDNASKGAEWMAESYLLTTLAMIAMYFAQVLQKDYLAFVSVVIFVIAEFIASRGKKRIDENLKKARE